MIFYIIIVILKQFDWKWQIFKCFFGKSVHKKKVFLNEKKWALYKLNKMRNSKTDILKKINLNDVLLIYRKKKIVFESKKYFSVL